MLADHVKAEVPGFGNIEAECLVRRRGIQPVRPPALVQRTILEMRRPIEADTLKALGVTHFRDRAEGSIALHRIQQFPVPLQADFHGIQVRRIRGPQLRLRDLQPDRLSRNGLGRCHHGTFRVSNTIAHGAFPYRNHRLVSRLSLGGKDGKVEAGKIRRNRVTLHMGLRHRLQPHTLPDARHRGVPDAGRIGNLLSTRLQVIIRAVQHPHFQGLFPTLQVRRNVKAESRIAAGMGAHVLAVEPYIGLPVHRPKMEEDLLLPALGQLESGAVPEGFISPWVTSHSGEGRLRAERHQDAAFRLGELLSLRQDGIVPKSVERQPVLPHQHGSGILRQYILRGNSLSPDGPDPLPRRRPLPLRGRT